MIQIPRKKVAVIPIFDSEETKGGIIKPSSFNYVREKKFYEIWDIENNRKINEADDYERARYLLRKHRERGYKAELKITKTMQEDQPLNSGERCDQGIVKYLGADVVECKIGDYVFFSGYTGTLMHIEGEGLLIILPEDFIECIFDIDEFSRVPGLYFKDRDGSYFEATYEQAMNIIAESFTILGKTIEVKTSRPKLEDYNVR